MKRARRGVSPVIATVLLILVAVAATVIIWTWVSGASSNNPTTQPALQEKLVIDAVQVNATNKTATIYVTNVGQVHTNITAAFVLDGINGTVVCGDTLNTNTTVSLKPGESGSVPVPGTCDFKDGHPYIAKVVSSRGISATYNFNG